MVTEFPPASGVTTKVEQFGRYTLFGKIAAGGMASVYLGRPNDVNEGWYAVKRVHPHLASRADVMQMFMNEAKILSRLEHQNVCGITDYGITDGSPFLVMRYLHGAPLSGLLRRILDRKDPIPIDLMAYVVACTCEGLHYAHEATGEDGRSLGLVHRDISPQNIFVTFAGDVKLLDFGVAKAAGFQSFTRTGHIKGKYAYMSPEQVEAIPLDRRSDVFSLGIVLWEMMTGRHLFKRKREIDTLRAITRAVVPAASEVNPEVPQSLDAIVAKALVADKNRRFASAHEMGQALWAHLTGATNPMGSDEVAEVMLATFPDKPTPNEIAQVRLQPEERATEANTDALEVVEAPVETDPSIVAPGEATDSEIDVLGAKTPRIGAELPDAAPTPHSGAPVADGEMISALPWADADAVGPETKTPSLGSTAPHEAETPMPRTASSGPNGTQRLAAITRDDSATDPPVPWVHGMGAPATARSEEGPTIPIDSERARSAIAEPTIADDDDDATIGDPTLARQVREVVRALENEGADAMDVDYDDQTVRTEPLRSRPAVAMFDDPHVDDPIKLQPFGTDAQDTLMDDRVSDTSAAMVVTTIPRGEISEVPMEEPAGPEIEAAPTSIRAAEPAERVATPALPPPTPSRWWIVALLILMGAAVALYVWIQTRPVAPPEPVAAPSAHPPDTPLSDDEALAQAAAMYREGNRALAAGRGAVAKKKLEECVELADLPECHRSLGVIYAREDKSTEAIRHYQRYLDLAPDAEDAPRVRELIAGAK